MKAGWITWRRMWSMQTGRWWSLERLYWSIRNWDAMGRGKGFES